MVLNDNLDRKLFPNKKQKKILQRNKKTIKMKIC